MNRRLNPEVMLGFADTHVPPKHCETAGTIPQTHMSSSLPPELGAADFSQSHVALSEVLWLLMAVKVSGHVLTPKEVWIKTAALDKGLK